MDKFYNWTCKNCGLNFRTRKLLRQHKKSCLIIDNERHKTTLNKRLIHFDEIKNTYVLYELLDVYISQGWEVGGNNNYSKNNKGICNDANRELERRKKISKTMKKNGKSGGYRINSGRGMKGIYKGFYCDSSWELAFIIYNIENNIIFERNTKQFEYKFKGIIHKYIPDFIIGDCYYEIKGYSTEQWKAKYESFSKNHKIEVIDKEKIKPYLDYVINKYGKDFIKLYNKER